MAKARKLSFGVILLQLALGLLLTISGIWTLMGGGDQGVAAIQSLIANRTIEKILVITYGVIEIIAGIFLILALFLKNVFGTFGTVLMIIIMIIWIIVIILIDFLSKRTGFLYRKDFLAWIYQFASHLIILGAIIFLKD